MTKLRLLIKIKPTKKNEIISKDTSELSSKPSAKLALKQNQFEVEQYFQNNYKKLSIFFAIVICINNLLTLWHMLYLINALCILVTIFIASAICLHYFEVKTGIWILLPLLISIWFFSANIQLPKEIFGLFPAENILLTSFKEI
ncbi:unnamed protein product [Blepharisma stoltei]|uniref:Uncharacterized protein n=1 Tax=Blepharisma stoltei TaxID=1481888 RepID=A0AAU9J106_9CILI|nr:unnamed protein product [Blepharisma stoltei]